MKNVQILKEKISQICNFHFFNRQKPEPKDIKLQNEKVAADIAFNVLSAGSDK